MTQSSPPAIELRSDTFTLPCAGMRQAMATALVGDDVYDEDPTVNRLQETIATLLGKEAALFVPSGTMSNQLAVRAHCQPGDELICDADCHIYNYEQGAHTVLSGVSTRPVKSEEGVLTRADLTGTVRPENVHFVRSRLLCLENTHNRAGGRVYPYDTLVDVCTWARHERLATHLDGARLFNAVVASGIDAQTWAAPFDTVSICFSKGLGAPVGSAVVGSKELIARAYRHRKLFGGAMRQVGILAAAALYALEHNISRLEEDHANARRLAAGIAQIPGLKLAYPRLDTNMVFFSVAPQLGPPEKFSARLAQHGVRINPDGRGYLRAVTHLNVSEEDIDRALEILRDVALQEPSSAEQELKFTGGGYGSQA